MSEVESLKTYVRIWTLVPACLVGALLGGALVWAWLSSAPVVVETAPASDPVADVKVVEPRPGSGAGRHPTFDCAGFEGDIPRMPDARAHRMHTIDALKEAGEVPEGSSVRVRAKVMAAYPKIMGANWLSLCDAEGGAVLVATTAAWAHKGAIVIVEGKLTRGKHIGGAYTFPLLLEDVLILSEEMPEGEVPVDL